jgi:hypothetical protein
MIVFRGYGKHLIFSNEQSVGHESFTYSTVYNLKLQVHSLFLFVLPNV